MTTTTPTDRSGSVLRFVPQGTASLLDDAPGWENKDGPTCWKCKGLGSPRKKSDNPIELPKHMRTREESLTPRLCPVCHGQGYLPKRKLSLVPGKITRGRKKPAGSPGLDSNMGPEPTALSWKNKWSDWVLQANKEYVDVLVSNEDAYAGPAWLPRIGEELCNLVGNWRILQRVGSHRWTTDDLVTAWVASTQQFSQKKPARHEVKYLDLGTGNGSVLQMVTWALLRDGHLVLGKGVEARSEAVELARRSLLFNMSIPFDTLSHTSIAAPVADIVHADFRDVELESDHFDLVTGTPPYFRVDFTVDRTKQAVSHAKIRQGGMPTSKQSAPARCEFRGGIEAYCAVAARVLAKESGRFVVCENWINHDRVVATASDHGLRILEQVQVSGREGKNTLFCVYVMRRTETEPSDYSPIVRNLAVRTTGGDWTHDYKRLVLSDMSIPF